MTGIASKFREYIAVNAEIKRLREQMKKLRERQEAIGADLLAFAETTSERGLRMDDHVVYIRDSKKQKPGNNKLHNITAVLAEANVAEPEEMAKRVLQAEKGEYSIVPKLKIAQASL